MFPASLTTDRLFLFSLLTGPRPKWPRYLDAQGRLASKGYTRPENQMPYDRAMAAAEAFKGQVGLYLTHEDDLCCLDLDGIHAASPELSADEQIDIQLAMSAAAELFEGKTYSETSLSGKGMHFFFRAKHMPPAFAVALDEANHRGIELYSANRYILLGKPTQDPPVEVAELQEEAEKLLELIADLRRKRGEPDRIPTQYSAEPPLAEEALDAIVAQIDEQMAVAEVPVVDTLYRPAPGRHWQWVLDHCPNCGEKDKPSVFLLDDGAVIYHCFHRNRCGEFKLREFCEKIGFRLAPPWFGNALFDDWGTPSETPCLPPACVDPPAPVSGSPESDAESARARVLDDYPVYAAEDLEEMDLREEYLIDRLLVADQPWIIGGASKSLKTSLALSASVSLATGLQFAGHAVQQPRRVLLLSGEGGLRVLRETIRRLVQHHNEQDASQYISVQDCQRRLLVSPRVPDLTSKRGAAELKILLQTHAPDIVLVDPAYLAFAADDANNMFALGQHLRRVMDICLGERALPGILHHITKTAGREKSLSLQSLAWAGWAQFAGQWWLISRHNEFDGRLHRLRLQVGNRLGGWADLGVEVRERIGAEEAGARVWEEQWGSWDESQARWRGRERAAQAEAEQSIEEQVMAHVREHGQITRGEVERRWFADRTGRPAKMAAQRLLDRMALGDAGQAAVLVRSAEPPYVYSLP